MASATLSSPYAPTGSAKHAKASFDYGNASKSLQEDCAKAVSTLQRMTHPDVGGKAASDNAILPVDYLKRCKGLQFLTVRTGGIGVSVTHGSGFSIQKLGRDTQGVQQWSGPCFCTVESVGFGLTLGFNELVTIMVLGSAETVNRLKRTDSIANLDGSFILGRNSSVADMPEDGADLIPFSLADGALLDVSFKGGAVLVAKKKNLAVYGAAADATSILDGQEPAPIEMQPLYELLNSICANEAEPV